jgi:hypothetical protein
MAASRAERFFSQRTTSRIAPQFAGARFDDADRCALLLDKRAGNPPRGATSY